MVEFGLAKMGMQFLDEKHIYLNVKEKMSGLGGQTQKWDIRKKPLRRLRTFLMDMPISIIRSLCAY